MPYAPAAPARAPAFCIQDVGIRISKNPNMERARRTRTAATPPSTQTDWSAEPKSLPESAAATPSPAYIVAMPST